MDTRPLFVFNSPLWRILIHFFNSARCRSASLKDAVGCFKHRLRTNFNSMKEGYYDRCRAASDDFPAHIEEQTAKPSDIQKLFDQ